MSAHAHRIREARDAGTPLRIAGAGTWLDAGRPCHPEGSTVSLAGDRGIVRYEPGDLTLTARAGTPIADLVAEVKANGQWLPLDPWGGDSGTIGATISTATAGPHAVSMGLPRDVVLGMELVTGNGDVIRPGGYVVKNVAGFDLTRLFVGSWGTLGVITEITMRLRARPAITRTLTMETAATRESLNDLAVKLRALPFTPLAAEVVNPALAFHLGIGKSTALIIRLGGNERAIAGQLELLREIGAAREFEERVWPALRTAEPSHAATWRWSQLPGLFGGSWTAAERALQDRGGGGTFIHGSPLRGVVRVIVSETGDATRLAKIVTGFDGTSSIERLPREVWPHVAAAESGPLTTSIRAKFDPRGVLNAGIIGGTA